MASRKGWEQLSPGYRQRLVRSGINKKQYSSGAPLAKARGHARTPEHGMKEALKRPRKFREYISRNPQQEAIELNSIRDDAYENMVRRVGSYKYFKYANVRANVYGGIRGPQHARELEHTEVDGMTYDEAKWTARADTEAIRSRASDQSHTNPWWYH